MGDKLLDDVLHPGGRNPPKVSSMVYALELEHLTKRFGGKAAVDDLTLRLKPGSFLGRMYGQEDAEADARREEVFAKLDLAPAPRALVAEYSYGLKKKLEA
ncbi:MAG: hypothetical protein HGA66_11000 [Holophaga sp.]|nr:hypothetical protein [Holophaga sp.]